MRHILTSSCGISMLMLVLLPACGRDTKEKESQDDTPFATSGGSDGTARMTSRAFAFELTALYAALSQAASASALVLGVEQRATQAIGLLEGQNPETPRCTLGGIPWNAVAGQEMTPASRDFAQLAFYCQFNAHGTRPTVRDTLEKNKKILCDLERVTGGPVYSEEGFVYEQVPLDPTLACGFRPEEITFLQKKNFKARLTATALKVGAWSHRLKIEIPNAYNVTLLFRSDSSMLAVKELDAWTQSDTGRENEYVPGDAEGVSGHIVAMQRDDGSIMAEMGDTYWGLRARLEGHGRLDPATGYLTDLKASKGVISRFDKAGPEGNSYLEALVASLTTDTDSRGIFSSASYQCASHSECNVNADSFETMMTLTAGAKTCVATAGSCDPTTGIDWKKDASTLAFLKIGGSWDDQGGTRGIFQDWLVKTPSLTFKNDLLSITPE